MRYPLAAMEFLAPGVCSFADSGVKVWGESSETIINSRFSQPYRTPTNSRVFIPNQISQGCRQAQADPLPTGKQIVLTLLWRVPSSWLYNTGTPCYCHPSLGSAAPRLVPVWVTVLPHSTAALSALCPPQTPHQPLRPGSGFWGCCLMQMPC